MDKTFSISGIQKEIKRIRWPKAKDTMTSTAEVIIYTGFFALFFVLCDFFVTFIMRMIGIGV